MYLYKHSGLSILDSAALSFTRYRLGSLLDGAENKNQNRPVKHFVDESGYRRMARLVLTGKKATVT